MSIATRTGDKGSTSLLYGKRVPKTHIRVQAYGDIDELGAAIGIARAMAPADKAEVLNTIQGMLIRLSGLLALADGDRERYAKTGKSIDATDLEFMDKQIEELETRIPPMKAFVHPGESLYSAHLHLARTICRRAERATLLIREADMHVDDIVLKCINRLSDMLWLMAREDEVKEA